MGLVQGCVGREELRASFNKLAGSKYRRWPGKEVMLHKEQKATGSTEVGALEG